MSTAAPGRSHYDVAEVKRAAAGRGAELLIALGGLEADLLDGLHHPCPVCGGTDRYRYDREQEFCYSNQCFAEHNGDVIAALRWLRGWDFPATIEALADYLGVRGESSHVNTAKSGRRQIVATYDYRDRDGVLAFQVVRFDPKDFRQRRPKDGGGWEWRVKGCPIVPYRLPELLAADPGKIVFAVEGERDVETLQAAGCAATCNAGGAGKWRREHAEYLRGRQVVVLIDKDEPGRKHGQQVAVSLQGVAGNVKVVELPGPGKDVSDWLADGGTAEQLFAIVDAAPEWAPAQTTGEALAGWPGDLVPLTDTGNAERFARQHANTVRYCHPWGKALVWDGRRWRLDDTAAIEQLAKQTARAIYAEAAATEDSAARAEIAKWAKRSESATARAAMIRLAQSEPPIPILPDALDRDPWLLNCENGTLDLRTGALLPHRREDYITKLCPVAFDRDAKCELWQKVLERNLAGNREVIDCLRRFAGYCLTGDVSEQILPIWYGVGSNGKSLMLLVWQAMLGPDYSMKAPPDLLMVKQGAAHPTERADLHGKRLVCCVETEDGRRLAESLVKELTGGDKIRARRMRENFWEFWATHKIILASNHKPVVRGTDHAIWRRLRLFPFTVVIPEGEKDGRLFEKLTAELPGILAWAVGGCLAWQRDGLRPPPEVMAATDHYRREQDEVADFLGAVCVVARDARVRSGDLLTAFHRWAGDTRMSQRRLGEALTDKGFASATVGGYVWRLGVGLREEEGRQ